MIRISLYLWLLLLLLHVAFDCPNIFLFTLIFSPAISPPPLIVYLLLSPFYFFLSDDGHPPSKGSLSVGNMISKLDHALLYYLCLVPTEYCDYYSLVKRVYLGMLVELSIDLASVAGLFDS